MVCPLMALINAWLVLVFLSKKAERICLVECYKNDIRRRHHLSATFHYPSSTHSQQPRKVLQAICCATSFLHQLIRLPVGTLS
ncbi:hypothetical protein CPB83DRAFT_580832 [Crepidotus variabilis]|uniref:Secreted protein n=1 Tax=Crepidotus variabilis TaxID=179855 RepID=A0A9P6EPU7_9AGAR|nr:hypothetical protein CPB83DRAFT_580832 [Crepidotus variabilis]